jgi:uncharacterized membrane protein
MMSQNRESFKDRIRAEEDYLINRIAEDEIRAVIARLDRQDQVLLHILERVERGHTLEGQTTQSGTATALPDPGSGGGAAPELSGPDEAGC